jgi:hypothetical protein
MQLAPNSILHSLPVSVNEEKPQNFVSLAMKRPIDMESSAAP